MTTTFENKASILADIWIQYRGEDVWEDFIEYNDMGLPLAYAVANGLATVETIGQKFIEETFDILLAEFDITEDIGFESLQDVLEHSAE